MYSRDLKKILSKNDIAEAKMIFLESLAEGWSIPYSKHKCGLRMYQFSMTIGKDPEVIAALEKERARKKLQSKSIADYRMLHVTKD